MNTLTPMSQQIRKYVQLTRPRIVMMVLFSLFVAAWCAGDVPPPWLALMHGLVGTALITAGSVAMNQWYEWRSDALMARTWHRPIPTGRVTARQGFAFGVGLSLCGLGYLAVFSTLLVTVAACANWAFYVTCYTPLKSRSAWQLPVGAVAGAFPMVIGGAIAGTPWNAMTLALFGIVFLWQFPHAIAIAWIYREHYACAGLQVVSLRDPSGRLSGILAVVGALLLIPVSLLPWALRPTGWSYAVVALLAGGVYLGLSVRFLRQPEDVVARRVLWASFFYLPALLSTLLAAS